MSDDAIKIFVADDNAKNLAFLQDLLEQRGYDVAIARNGDDALKRILRLRPDMILLDIMMPGKPGLEVCRELKKDERVSSIPVIFTTALALEEEKVAGLKAGAVDYVTKPIAQDELLTRMEVHLQVAQLTRELEQKNEQLEQSNRELQEEVALRQKTEDQLVRSERFAAVGTLLQGVAHEFNNIHHSLGGYLDLCLNNPSSEEVVKTLLLKMKDGLSRQSRIITDLLSTSGQTGLRTHPSNPSRVVRDALSLASYKLDHQRIEVLEGLTEGEVVLMDPDQIGQVLLNLFINACDAMLETPHPRLQVKTWSAEDEFFILVEDNGCGIEEKLQREVFSPFFTTKGEFSASNDAQSEIRGNGLGLSVCEKIVQRHGGRIEMESEPGSGTTFRVVLPRKSLSNTDVPAPEKENRDGERKGIMIVDDDEDIQFMFKFYFKEKGISATFAKNGKEALEMARECCPALIVLDLNMPVMDGYEFLRVFKKDQKDTKLFVVTGMPQDFVREKLEGFTYEEILSKPVDLHRILKMAQSVS